NQREVDIIAKEVIPVHCPNVKRGDVAVIAPYVRQVDKAAAALDADVAASTVHKVQGRASRVVIFSTVLDTTWRGRTGLPFVDDPKMIKVAVSRAIDKFVLVTNNDLMPDSRHIQDLVDYIRYQFREDAVAESSVLSVFDLLYQEYDQRLRPLAARLRQGSTYLSENIAWTVLHDLLDEERHGHLTAARQVLLWNLIPDLAGLTPRQAAFVRHPRASLDFVVYNRISNRAHLAVEVDGFAFHENKPEQLARDAMKKHILGRHEVPLLRLPTTGSGEEQRIRRALDDPGSLLSSRS
ncbi:MAG: AAA domain-containing protein, partial [Dermatophilaceae bacterium]